MPIEYITDKNKNLLGFVDFWIVDESGKLNRYGEKVFINEFYLNPSCRNKGMIAKFAWNIMRRVPWAKYGYYKRRKHSNRIKIFDRVRWLNIVKKNNSKEEHYGRN
jgi:hypothetical protein